MKYTYEQALLFAHRRDACLYVMNALQNHNTWQQLREAVSLPDLCTYARWFAYEIHCVDDTPGELGDILLNLYRKLTDDIEALEKARWNDHHGAHVHCAAELNLLIDEGDSPDAFAATAKALYEEMRAKRRAARDQERIGVAMLRTAFLDAFHALACDDTPQKA